MNNLLHCNHINKVLFVHKIADKNYKVIRKELNIQNMIIKYQNMKKKKAVITQRIRSKNHV